MKSLEDYKLSNIKQDNEKSEELQRNILKVQILKRLLKLYLNII